jgi:hypothetical protein
MNQHNDGNWSASPWLGEFASTQFALWRAGCEWAAKSNWFVGNLVGDFAPKSDSVTAVDQHDVANNP